MIRKLQRKFILINMIFVMTILTAMFAFLYHSYTTRVKWDNNAFMDRQLTQTMMGGDPDQGGTHIGDFPPDPVGDKHQGPGEDAVSGNGKQKQDAANFFEQLFNPPVNGKRGGFLPYVIYTKNADGTLTEIESRDLSINENTAETLVSQIPELSAGDKCQGYIKAYALRYTVRKNESGTPYILFADVSYANSTTKSFLLVFISIFAFASLLFFVLSFFLSRWALVPVQKAWDQQNRFVADASHELKTPITVILANLDILASHPQDTIKAQSRWIRNTKEEAECMRQLVQDLLFLAKSDAHTLPVVFSEVDLSFCTEDRVLNFESVAFEKNVELESDVAEGLKVSGNEGQLKQLITILLDNAVKYAGPKGHAKLTAGKIQDKIVISVNNTGDPISPEDQQHIFERFYRTDKSRARTEGGYGLGLAIAENIVNTHKGTIKCVSNAENGTTFTVELPALG